MKQTLLLAATILLLASCNNGNNGEAEMYKKQVDSLTKIVQAMPPAQNEAARFATNNDERTPSDSLQQFSPGINDSIPFLNRVDTATANIWIQNFHKEVIAHMPKSRNSMSFLIDVRELNFLTAQAGVTQVAAYITKNGDDLGLVFVAAKPDGSGKITEMPVKFTDVSGVFVENHVSPCPDCSKNGIHSGAPIKTSADGK